jgi:precorrin-6Y C5,15-methyltransferase (decarboxylating)
VEDFNGEIIPIAPVQSALDAIERHLERGNVGVLASGDPLFFGIGRTLLERFGDERVDILPGLSFLQLACARFKIPWDDAGFVSLHGRSSSHVAAALLRHPKVIVFTDSHFSPDQVAGALVDYLELIGADRILADLHICVGENLGMQDEKLVEGTVRDIAAGSFAPVNLMIITRVCHAGHGNGLLGLTETDFRYSRGLITKDEVRAVTLHKLQLPRQGILWDIGGGSGSISIEAARLCPELIVYTIEKDEEQLKNICHNITAFETFNVVPVAGVAPDALADLPAPDRVFVGGSGGRLAEILGCCTDRLKVEGRIVVNCVLEKTRKAAPLALVQNGCEVALTEIHVNRISDCREKEKRIELNPITIVTGKK